MLPHTIVRVAQIPIFHRRGFELRGFFISPGGLRVLSLAVVDAPEVGVGPGIGPQGQCHLVVLDGLTLISHGLVGGAEHLKATGVVRLQFGDAAIRGRGLHEPARVVVNAPEVAVVWRVLGPQLNGLLELLDGLV